MTPLYNFFDKKLQKTINKLNYKQKKTNKKTKQNKKETINSPPPPPHKKKKKPKQLVIASCFRISSSPELVDMTCTQKPVKIAI